MLKKEAFGERFTIGKVCPGVYKIGKGMYTGEKGWEEFLKVLKEELNNLK